MDFSEIIKQSNQLVEFSPNGSFVAAASASKLVIRDVQKMEVVHSFICIDQINYIQWSADSAYLLCGMFKKSIVQVWSLNDVDWKCKIDEGSAGLQEVTWSPDSRHILTTSLYHLKITIWSLVNKSVEYIKYPKAASPGLDFTKDMKYLAVAERRHSKDYISIFICSIWQLVKHFECATKDLAGICWSPRDHVICTWDAPLEEYSILLYSTNGHLLGSYSAYKWSLGIRCISWSPSGQFLAVGSFDQKLRLLNPIICMKITEFEHPETIDSSTNATVYVEKITTPRSTTLVQVPGLSLPQSHYEILEKYPFTVPSITIDMSKADPKHGIKATAFSPDNRFVYAVNGVTPNTCWIYSVEELLLSSIIVQSEPIKCLDWHPSEAKLALGTSNSNVYVWCPSSCTSVPVPHNVSFQVTSVQWSSSGRALMLVGKGNACLCYL